MTESERRPSGGAGLSSFFLGGFECSCQRRTDGRQMDLLASTGHADLAREDYAALVAHGITAMRDGLRWHLIETAPGRYDWSSAVPMLRAARQAGVQVIWDLCHYGWPHDVDIWSDEFPARLAAFAREAARLIREESGEAPLLCPVNEISYWAWAGGEMGRFGPCAYGRGSDLKRQLVRAAIAATRAVREVEPEARFICAEPLIHVDAGSITDHQHVTGASYAHQSQFEALDLLIGQLEPELGGSPDLLDILGVNFYPDNQWYHGGGTIPLGHHAYRPLVDLLDEWFARYRRPMLIAETGAEGSARPSWLHYVCGEVAVARDKGVPVEGICLYPVANYPGWDDERHCATGLLSGADEHGRRQVYAPLARELQRQQALLGGRDRHAPDLIAAE